MPDTAQPCTVYAPVGAVWQHFRAARWARWVRAQGYRGRLPACAVTICSAAFPAPTCACGMYQVRWKEDDSGEETDED